MAVEIKHQTHLAEAQAIQDAIYRAMTPAQKLGASMQMYWSARKLKAAWIRQQHPDWTPVQIEEAVREVFLNARS